MRYYDMIMRIIKYKTFACLCVGHNRGSREPGKKNGFTRVTQVIMYWIGVQCTLVPPREYGGSSSAAAEMQLYATIAVATCSLSYRSAQRLF